MPPPKSTSIWTIKPSIPLTDMLSILESKKIPPKSKRLESLESNAYAENIFLFGYQIDCSIRAPEIPLHYQIALLLKKLGCDLFAPIPDSFVI
jgi:hypothetical protein